VIKASVVGATGFTGAVLTDLLARHPRVRIEALTSASYAGLTVAEVFPRLRVDAVYQPYDPERLAETDVAFVCYPHAESFPVVAELVDAGKKVIDLSADFRLKDPELYPEWYGFDHPREDLLAEAVYGLPELYREEIACARLVANPGCYPTSMLLGLLPLTGTLRPSGAYRLSGVIVDSKSGVSGAGRKATEKTHFCSVHDDFRAYSEIGHRHTAEMVQELSLAAGEPTPISFTPHLLPLDRGILSTLYCRLLDERGGTFTPSTADLQELYSAYYQDEPFVEVVSWVPSLSEVQETNYCRMAVRMDQAAGVVKIISVIDNLIKGASGQAVQNLNIMCGFEERLGLEGRA
jgi:N-acetyl-gamma-glutamyl-phosphate reductase